MDCASDRREGRVRSISVSNSLYFGMWMVTDCTGLCCTVHTARCNPDLVHHIRVGYELSLARKGDTEGGREPGAWSPRGPRGSEAWSLKSGAIQPWSLKLGSRWVGYSNKVVDVRRERRQTFYQRYGVGIGVQGVCKRIGSTDLRTCSMLWPSLLRPSIQFWPIQQPIISRQVIRVSNMIRVSSYSSVSNWLRSEINKNNKNNAFQYWKQSLQPRDNIHNSYFICHNMSYIISG